ncbi:hypothetical protein RHGRI_026614 [Rhododendron griersonianum]|uniref:RNase H type-1 domain-containing protein n=1 Tax=Rhododendron griersonianum TaxID=479676 RepID=A0AAV6IYF6_9ERIC|nr:hypothetical protein RHGRI_026614 [Rhododendron griersonianum]
MSSFTSYHIKFRSVIQSCCSIEFRDILGTHATRGFAQLDLYSVEILNSGNLDQSKFGRLHQSGFACKQQGVAAWYASGVDHGKEVLGCTRVVATYAAMVEGIAALQPHQWANSRGYRQVKILTDAITDAMEVVLGIRKADIFRDFSCSCSKGL